MAAANTDFRFTVRNAEDRAAVAGLVVLLAGFTAQGLGYVLYIGGAPSSTRGDWARLAAAGFLLLGFTGGFLLGRATRGQVIRRYLVEIAHHDQHDKRHRHSWGKELCGYAAVLGLKPDPAEYRGHELTGDALRYWKVKRVRTNADTDE